MNGIYKKTEYIQLNLDCQHAIMEQYPKWHTKWSLLNDPIGRGMSEVLTATIQNVRAQRKELKKNKEGDSLRSLSYAIRIYSAVGTVNKTG